VRREAQLAQISDTVAENIVRTIVTTIDFAHGLTYEVLRSGAGFRVAPTPHEREFLLGLVRLSVVAGESLARDSRHSATWTSTCMDHHFPLTKTFRILTQGFVKARVRR
jgi:hypothetical protein